MTIPNYLTLSRIVILPFFLFFFFANLKYHYIIAGSLFLLSALTDLFDGYIARKFNQVSQLGKILDPLADKLTVISIFGALTAGNFLPLNLMFIILSRELVILIGASFVYFEDKEVIEASKVGKTATFLLYLSGASYIWHISLLKPLIFIAIPLTLFSGVRYCVDSYNYFFRGTKYQN